MLRQGGGAIVNISSLAAIRWTGYPYFAYYATKAAVNQATVALAMQYARQGIRANCIMPGLIDTPLIYRQISGQYASVEEMIAARNAAVPVGRMGTAWDVANAAVFLASDEAQFITGVCLPVDGGQSCAVSPSFDDRTSSMVFSTTSDDVRFFYESAGQGSSLSFLPAFPIPAERRP
jgi:NAD(P)-dependent dehydrogenase (short-subunit alcohol dehydrogenase family)